MTNKMNGAKLKKESLQGSSKGVAEDLLEVL